MNRPPSNESSQIAGQLMRERIPLSFGQERLRYLDQKLGRFASSYNIPLAWRIQGPLDHIALQRSLAELVTRHEVLRTRIGVSDGQPIQIIGEPAGFGLATTDLRALGDARREQTILRLMRAEAERPFDLERGPLFRASLLVLAADDSVLLLTMHHIVTDAWSINKILPRDLESLYSAFRQGRQSSLPELPWQYADYAIWQRERLRTGGLRRNFEYWRAKLEGAPSLDLPSDFVRPAVPSFRGAARQIRIPIETCSMLSELGRRRRATLYMVLLAAFQLVLGRWTRQQDIVVASPSAGRAEGQTDDLVGFFVNTLLLRTSLAGDLTFVELLDRVKRTCLAAYAHQEIPAMELLKLTADGRSARDESKDAPIQVMFGLQNVTGEELHLPGLVVSPLTPDRTIVSKYDLYLDLEEHPDYLHCHAEYATDLFSQVTIDGLLDRYRSLLEEVAVDPHRRVTGTA